MASPKEALYKGRLYTPATANAVRSELVRSGKVSPEFVCPECRTVVTIHLGKKVNPNTGKKHADHFEHEDRNADCSLSTPARSRKTAAKSRRRIRFDPESPAAAEGYDLDRKHLTTQKGRDRQIAIDCKEHYAYTCQACGWQLHFDGKWIIDCHHKTPINYGARETTLSDLVALCPTCHRIAHLDNPPLDLADIKRVRRNARLA